MTLKKLRSKALQGTSDYEIKVGGKRVTRVYPNHKEKTLELVLEGEESMESPEEPTQQEEYDPATDLLDTEGNYVLF